MKSKIYKDFVAFILTHGRPDNVITYDALIKQGYTGPIYLIVDNEDEKAEDYKKKYGDKVIIFDKEAVSKTFDGGDNSKDRRSIVYARNVCFEIAEGLGYKYFIQLDDDYTNFYIKHDEKFEYANWNIKNLNEIFNIMIDYYKSIDAKSIAFAQNGDFIGGKQNQFHLELKPRRKCMNTFFCSTDRPFKFLGRINEDVNTYTRLASTGDLFFTVPNVAIAQKQTQSNKGGMTDIYLDGGTYLKSFFTVIFSPSCVKISDMGDKNPRLHHQVCWKNAVPLILSEDYKK